MFGSYGLAQSGPNLPQRTALVSATQALHFGDLTVLSNSSGGTVSVDYNGIRSATGSVVLLNMGNAAQQGIFELKICPGRLINITYNNTITLTGSNGGSLLLHVGPANIGASGATFLSNKGCDDTHYITVGGTLDVSSVSSNPAGLYTGTFSLTFVQQ